MVIALEAFKEQGGVHGHGHVWSSAAGPSQSLAGIRKPKPMQEWRQ